ncbi:PA4642 family protein [Spartinivicinus poritis]|uniref:PA4642 family protein n=1 Tax=Spartinivicinus poritis TaxID=2994640 RepID=A0ABT5U9J0_9GAMM|nr:PA4642 family protein [Spartinivicinus sp. A2-2]MDE1463029.1 PA4642 family protein [Spartinivicinus sp. A2-2]
MKKDKQKVIGEDVSDERLKELLATQSYDGTNNDYHILTNAYRALREDDFSRFLTFFIAAGHNINARNKEGETFLTTISCHQQAKVYINALKQAGAN